MFRGRSRPYVAVAATLLLVGCAGAAPVDEPIEGDAEPGLTGELTIFAAASLATSFTELADEFSRAHPDVTVHPISFGGSSTLATQINEGAPADVFASADQANMDKVDDLIGGSTVFAHNTLQIAVVPGNPLGITGLADLAEGGVQVVLCAPEVPCGAASQQLLSLNRLSISPASEEQNVKAVFAKVQAGEADAGLVYVTEITAGAGAVDGVDIDGTGRAANAYLIAVLTDSPNSPVAQAFVDYVLSAEGEAILAKYGFSAP